MPANPVRKGDHYRQGELEVILSLVPSKPNIGYLAELLDRTPEAIEIVYRLAYDSSPFGKTSTAQQRKIAAAKKKLGIPIGPPGPA